MQLTILGSGTSHGVPVIGCNCKVCRSKDIKDKRNRCSALVAISPRKKVSPCTEVPPCAEVSSCDGVSSCTPSSLYSPTFSNKSEHNILIDCGPEFRMQALTFGVKKIDTVLLTHAHIDHIAGLDDLRVFSHTETESAKNETKVPLNIYGNTTTLENVKKSFHYIFEKTQNGGGKPKFNLIDWKIVKNESLSFSNVEVFPIPMLHGSLPTTGYLFVETILPESVNSSLARKCNLITAIAYLTDCSSISRNSINLIKKHAPQIEHLVIDALRSTSHPTHFSFEEALSIAEELSPKHTWFTHICHAFSHREINFFISEQIKNYPRLAKIAKNGGTVKASYDGLKIKTKIS